MKTINQIQQEENCFGYYGFGTGISMSSQLSELSKLGNPVAGQVNQSCDKCMLAQTCWQSHRERVMEMLPSLCEIVDEHVKLGKTGPEIMKHFQDNKMPEPYMTIMMGNIEDGAHVKATGNPKDRGVGTLTYPFKKGGV